MSVERLQTVLQLSATGADQVIGEINRVLTALKQTTGDTSMQLLNPSTLQQVQGQRPQSYSKIEELQAQQLLAQRRLNEATKAEGKLRESSEANVKDIAAAEATTLRAAIAESRARGALAEALYKLLPEVQQEANRQREQVASNARWDAEEQRLNRERIARKRADAEYAFGGDPQRAKQAQRDLFTYEQQMAELRKRELEVMRAEATDAFSQLPSSTAIPRAELDAMLKTPTRQEGDTDKVYRARQVLADAEISAGVAHSRLAEAVRRAEMGEGESQPQLRMAVDRARVAYDQASRGVTDSERKLQTAIDTEAQARAQNTRRTLREDFLTGFKGSRFGGNAPGFGEQIGQAFKFSVFYGTAYKVLFALTQTLQQTFQEGVQFQQAMTDLAIAAERPKEQLDQIAASLGRSATRAGFAPSQGIEIGARALGLYGVTESDQATQDRVMQISARVVNQLAVGSKQQPVDLQNNIAAIAQALGLGAAGQFRIADLDAYMTKKFGAPQGSTLEAVSQAGVVGKAAGFTDQQLFAIAADMITRTGQTSSAVGGFMAQMFTRGGEGSLVNVAQSQGIDTKQSLSQVIEQLATKYQSADPNTKEQIAAAFGRGKVQNAAVALLSDYKEVLMRSAKAQEEAQGQADAQFKAHMGDIGGQLAQLQGVMKDFASELSKSGLLDVVGLGIVAFRDLLEAATGLIRVWNSLSKPIRDVAIGLSLFGLALKTNLAQNVLGSIAFRGGMSTGVGAIAGTYRLTRNAALLENAGLAMGPGGRLISTATGFNASPTVVTRALEEPTTGAALKSGVAGLAAGGRAALGLVNPVTIAIGGLLAVGALKNSADQMRAAQESATEALTKPSADLGSSASEHQAYAAELRNVAQQNREATGLFANIITGYTADNANQATARRLDAEAKRQDALARMLEARAAAVTTQSAPSVFTSFGATDLSNGISQITAAGGTATTALDALRAVLYHTADAAQAATTAFKPDEFAAEAAGGVLGAVLQGFKGKTVTGKGVLSPDQARGVLGPSATGLDSVIADRLSGKDVQDRLAAGMQQLGVTKLADLDASTATKLADIVGGSTADQIIKDLGPGYKSLGPVIRRAILRMIRNKLLADSQSARDLASPNTRLSATDATSLAQSLVSESDARLGDLGNTNYKGQAAELRQRIRDLSHTQRRAGKDEIPYITQQMATARSKLVDVLLAESDSLRRAAMQDAGSRRQANALGHRYLVQDINTIVNRGGNADQLATLIAKAGKDAKAIARDAINKAMQVVRASLDTLGSLDTTLALAGGGHVGDFRSGDIGKASPLLKELQRLQSLLDALNGRNGATPHADKGSNAYAADGGSTTKQDRETPAEIAAAQAAAYATRSQGQMAAASAAIQGARAALNKAKHNTVEYWNAMGSLFDSQNQLTAAVEAYKHNLGMLSIDMTNPLAVARLAVRDAARKLRDDAGKAPDVVAQDKVDLRTAQANEESTRFSQRLQQVQTAEELGRISHRAYIHYLDSEKRRLEAIKHRTFQQQDELNQVDRLMKEAADQMQAQWNFGDIKLPTPYQVRRYIEEQSGSRDARLMSARAGNTSVVTTNNVYINGADVAMVKRTIEQYVGTATRTRTAQARRR